MSLLAIWLCLVASNVLYQLICVAFFGHGRADWDVASERSFFQGAALLLVHLNSQL